MTYASLVVCEDDVALDNWWALVESYRRKPTRAYLCRIRHRSSNYLNCQWQWSNSTDKCLQLTVLEEQDSRLQASRTEVSVSVV